MQKEITVLDICNISFGNMVKINNYKNELIPILNEFKEKDLTVEDELNKGNLTVLLNGYGKATLEDMSNVISYIQEKLGEYCTFEMEFKNIEEISEYIHITLIRLE